MLSNSCKSKRFSRLVKPKPIPGSSMICSRSRPAFSALASVFSKNAHMSDSISSCSKFANSDSVKAGSKPKVGKIFELVCWGRAMTGLNMAITGAPALAATAAILSSPKSPVMSLMILAPAAKAASATDAFQVSTEMRISVSRRSASITGTTRPISASISTKWLPGRVDSPPISSR